MNKDIKNYGVYFISNGELEKCTWIESTDDYNHITHNLHHFIPKGWYKRNKAWCDERGIKQKLILMPVWLHLELHNLAYTDEEFKNKNKIDRWTLVFSRKHWR